MGKRENPENLVGKKINKLLVVKHLGMRPTGTFTDKKTGKKYIIKTRYYLYRCECGREREAQMGNLKKQKGCRYCGKKQTNPISYHPFNSCWNGFIRRNYNKVGGRYELKDKNSIQIYDRWLRNFESLIKDLGEPPTPKHVLGRIDKSKGFIPGNCKWMTRKERGNSSKYFNQLTQTNISKHVGLSRERIRQILNVALRNKEDELNNLIERIDNTEKYKRIIFKPEAIDFFKKKKYILKTKYMIMSDLIFKEYYSKGIDMETAAKKLNKPITSIKRYYTKFKSTDLTESTKRGSKK